jgi:hypothetical protein
LDAQAMDIIVEPLGVTDSILRSASLESFWQMVTLVFFWLSLPVLIIAFVIFRNTVKAYEQKKNRLTSLINSSEMSDLKDFFAPALKEHGIDAKTK